MNNKIKPEQLLPTANEALKIIDENFTFCPDFEVVDIFNANERILAEDIFACEFVPSFNRSAMDGYSVYAEDVKYSS